MPAYRELGRSFLFTAIPDSTGRNPGNWTITADLQAINARVAQAEMHQANIDGPVGSTMSLFRGTRCWNRAVQGWSNTYDPVNPLYVHPGDTLFLYWAAPVSFLPVPTATLWFRYDTELPENKYGAGAG